MHVHDLLPFMLLPLGRVNTDTDGTGDAKDSPIEIVPADGTHLCRRNFGTSG